MGTHYKGSESDELTLDTFIKLTRASESVTIRLNRHLSEHGLTLSQFGTLEVLLHLGPLNQRAIGEKLLKSGGNITMVIDNLVKNGMVTRKRNPADRRAVLIELSEKGRAFITDFFPLHLERIREEFSVLDPDEMRELGRICRKLGLGEADVNL